MNPAEATIIMQTLLSCQTLFSDFFPIPNFVTITSFQYTSSDGITVQEWTNGTEGPKKKIKFNATGVLFDKIQLQMVEKDGTMVLGGQAFLRNKNNDTTNCPLVGNVDELRLLFPGKSCVTNCFYRIKDLIYQINYNAGLQCIVHALNGTIVRKFDSPPQLDCSSPYGFLPEEDLFVFMKNGECKQVDYSEAETSWAVTSCPRREIELAPNKLSQYYHLRYLLTISGCGENVTDIEDPDNVYVRFMHKNETLIEPTEPPSTTVVVVHEESHIQEYLAYGLFAAVGFVLVVLVILAVIYRKKLKEKWDKCRGKKEPSATEHPLPPASKPSSPYELYEVTTQDLDDLELEQEEEGNLAMDTVGNVDENLKSANPMDMLLELKMKPGETFEDEQAKWTLPTIVNCLQPYKLCGFLGAGRFGRVYKYAVLSQYETYVAIKFVRTDLNERALVRAKQEFMLIRQIQNKFKATDEYYLLRVVDVGRYPKYVFIVSPFYYRSMDFFMPKSKGFEKATTADILTVAWNYLKCIQQLHSVGYGHNDIKPANFMQKDQGSNTIILCDFGLVALLGSKRRRRHGDFHYLPMIMHYSRVTSNVDDHQSWLSILCMMLKRSRLWVENMKLKRENRRKWVEDLCEQKKAFFDGILTPLPNEMTSPEAVLIYELSKAIVEGQNPKNPVDPKKVVSIMEKAQSTFNFKYATYEWWRFDYDPDKK